MWTSPHNRIKGIEALDGTERDALVALPIGVDPVTKGSALDLERLKKEVTIVYPIDPALRKYPWAREAFFRSKSKGIYRNRLLVAYSVDAARRIVRGWYLTEFDRSPHSWYRGQTDCPIEAAWLATIAIKKPSEPAWLYMRPNIPIDDPDRLDQIAQDMPRLP
jgi:hypothetical protein